ncbi:MAG TPA: hypothetical protein VI911_10460 [Patescibacteria group bacterium]|nr:hypothetical protein [Patescibacteria group bacterium]
MKSVKVSISKDRAGDYVAKYEVEGYSGLGCEEVAQVLSALGTQTDRKTSDSAYQQEIPVPIPVRQQG